MSFLLILFGLKGRLARLPYLGYNLLLLIIVLITAFAGAGLIGMNRGRSDDIAVGIVLLAGACILGLWSGLALIVKRLHDMGLAGWHVLWLCGVGIVGGAVAVASQTLGILFNLISLGIWLWLLISPGQSQANRYGPASEAALDRGLDGNETIGPRTVNPSAAARRGRFREAVLLLGGTAAVLTVAIGLAMWSMQPVPLQHRDIFEQAVTNLAVAQGLRYTGAVPPGDGRKDVTTSAFGHQLGTIAGQGFSLDILRMDEKLYARNAAGADSSLDPWILGPPEQSNPVELLLKPLEPPLALAERLLSALDKMPDAPATGAVAPSNVTVRGVPALRAETGAGTLYVSREPPYRVLRLEPSGLERILLQMVGSADDLGLDLFPLSDSEAAQMYDALQKRARQLANAVDSSIRFKLDGDGTVNCSNSRCSAETAFTGTLSGGTKVRITGGEVRASMQAAFTIDGRSAGRCSSQVRTFSLAGSTVSGQLSCFAPEAGPVFAAVYAEHDARERARTPPGQEYRVNFPYGAQYRIVATAMAAGEVERLLSRLQEEQGRKNPCNSFGASTPVVTKDGLKRIDQVNVGDLVLARDEKTGASSWKPVTERFFGLHKETVHLVVRVGDGAEEEILSSKNHPIFVEGKGWIQAGELQAGDRVLTADEAQAAVVVSVQVEQEPLTAFNLEVAERHTYFVGKSRVWVHNRTRPCPPRQVRYGMTKLSQAVIAERIARKDFMAGKTNYAAAIVETPKTKKNGRPERRIIVERNEGELHSEQVIAGRLQPGERIVELYSERRPCPTCRGLVAMERVSPDAEITFTFPYSPEGRRELQNTLNKLKRSTMH